MSVVVSFPLMVYPLRASLHSLIFQQVSDGIFYIRDASMIHLDKLIHVLI